MKIAPFRIFHLNVLLVCIVVNLAEGYDIAAAAYVIPYLEAGFSGPQLIGVALTASLVGMAIGAAAISPIADRVGRRPVLLSSLLFNAVTLALCGLAPNIEFLIVSRLLSGLSIGAISGCLVVLLQEFASTRNRSLMSGLMAISTPFGSLLAGLLGVGIMNTTGTGWPTIFYVGAILNFAALLLAIPFLPESVDYLASSTKPRAREKLARLVTRMRLEGVDLDQRPAPAQITGTGWRVILHRTFIRRTLLSWVMYIGVVAALYFILSWTPKLIATASGDPNVGTLTTNLFNVGGVVGVLIVAFIGLRVPAGRITIVASIVSLAAMVVFALSINGTAAIMLVLAAFLGIAVWVTIAAITIFVPFLYPSQARTAGYGSMIALGRVGSIAAPLVAGFLVLTVSTQAMYLIFSSTLVLCTIAASLLWFHTRAEILAERREAEALRAAQRQSRDSAERTPAYASDEWS